MDTPRNTPRRSATATPWFRRHPYMAIAVSTDLFIAIFLLRLAVDGAQDPITMLYVLPVALLAVTFGLRVGTAAGLGAVALIIIWCLITGETLTPLGWFSRAVPLILIGSLVGLASDKLRAADHTEQLATALADLQRETAEITDSVVQGMAAAKWLLESGDVGRGTAVLDDTMEAAQALVTKILGADSPLPEHARSTPWQVRPSPPSSTPPV